MDEDFYEDDDGCWLIIKRSGFSLGFVFFDSRMPSKGSRFTTHTHTH